MKAMRNPVQTQNQKGFTIVEALVVLGLFAAFIAAVVAATSGTTATQVAQTESRVVNGAASKLKNIYRSRSDFAGLNQAAANDLRVFDETMGDPAVNSFGGTVDVFTPPGNPKGAVPNGSRQFQIDWTVVSGDVCPELASMAQTDAIGVDVDGVEVFNQGVTEIDPIAVGANCAEGVTVSFIYGK